MSQTTLRSFYESHLFEQVLPFWIPLVDREHGGIINAVRNDGTITSYDKYIWSQGRALWVYSSLYNNLEREDRWLEIAHNIAGLLMGYGRTHGGLWPFVLGRDGSVREPAQSIYVDAFVAYGLTEYARATGNEEAVEMARAIFRNTSPMLEDHAKLDTRPHPIPENLQSHGPLMIFALVYHDLGVLTGDREILDRALELAERIMTEHVKPEDELLYELVKPGGEITTTDAGLTFVPGHVIESMWFLERIYAHHGNRDRIDLCMEVMRWNLEKGWDNENGGIFLSRHHDGGSPVWNDPGGKAWWPHTEALYGLLVAQKHVRQSWAADWYNRVHDYSFSRFPNREHGDWYHYIDDDGNPVESPVRNLTVKDPFHLPRTLIYAITLLRETAANRS